MIIILFAFFVALMLYKCKGFISKYRSQSPVPENPSNNQFDDLASISALQETVLIDQGKQLDSLSKEVHSLKRKLSELEK